MPLLPGYVKMPKRAVKTTPSIPDKIVLNEAEYGRCYGYLIYSLPVSNKRKSSQNSHSFLPYWTYSFYDRLQKR
jgi:hypothetical protein